MWKVEKGFNSVGMYEYEIWMVTNDKKYFDCGDNKENAEWLAGILNNLTWKKCSDEHPPIGVPVYAYGDKHGNRTDGQDDNIDICSWDGDSWWEDNGTEVSEWGDDGWTYWMPLPEPPKNK